MIVRITKLALLVCVIAVVSLVAMPALAGTPNAGNSGIKGIEESNWEFRDTCPDGTVLDASISGYYMYRWDTLMGEVFAVENVNIDWLFTNPDGETWTFRERGVSVVREGDELLIVSNNGHHNHWRFGAHIGHRVFTTNEDGSSHVEEILEAGMALGTVFEEACDRLAG
jgi:hypothetical protein